MEMSAEWIEAQHALFAASRQLDSLKTLPKAQRAILGRHEYVQKCKFARVRMKMADDHCVTVRRRERLSRSGPALNNGYTIAIGVSCTWATD